jgi:N-terminal domain of anti-restriction factor ArdC
MRTDIYQRITDQIIGELEKGVRPWMKPEHAQLVGARVTISWVHCRCAPVRVSRTDWPSKIAIGVSPSSNEP